MYKRTYNRRYKRRPTYKRRRYPRRSYRVKYNKTNQKVFYYKRYTGGLGFVTTTGLAETFIAYNFSLADVPNSAEFTALYDMYKINGIQITFIPQMTQNISVGTVNNVFASLRFFSAIDYNDSTAVSSIDAIREYQTCKYTSVLRTHKRYIPKPKMLDGSNSTSLVNWVATSSPATNYYGLKIAIETTGNPMTFAVEAKYYLSFKNVK